MAAAPAASVYLLSAHASPLLLLLLPRSPPPRPVCCSGSPLRPFDAEPWPGVKWVLAALCWSSKERWATADVPLGLMRSPDALAGEDPSRPSRRRCERFFKVTQPFCSAATECEPSPGSSLLCKPTSRPVNMLTLASAASF